ncbi:hypothetical protein MJT46_012437 [Ovis ammon polii x Ovis aries]|nr:hypothetical protein MJT46_012437 [Ovis ammon polii x Ovis aries]
MDKMHPTHPRPVSITLAIFPRPPDQFCPLTTALQPKPLDRNNRSEEKTEEKERKQRPEGDSGEERRGGEQQESLSNSQITVRCKSRGKGIDFRSYSLCKEDVFYSPDHTGPSVDPEPQRGPFKSSEEKKDWREDKESQQGPWTVTPSQRNQSWSEKPSGHRGRIAIDGKAETQARRDWKQNTEEANKGSTSSGDESSSRMRSDPSIQGWEQKEGLQSSAPHISCGERS